MYKYILYNTLFCKAKLTLNILLWHVTPTNEMAECNGSNCTLRTRTDIK